jgi:hypothetical protein
VLRFFKYENKLPRRLISEGAVTGKNTMKKTICLMTSFFSAVAAWGAQAAQNKAETEIGKLPESLLVDMPQPVSGMPPILNLRLAPDTYADDAHVALPPAQDSHSMQTGVITDKSSWPHRLNKISDDAIKVLEFADDHLMSDNAGLAGEWAMPFARHLIETSSQLYEAGRDEMRVGSTPSNGFQSEQDSQNVPTSSQAISYRAQERALKKRCRLSDMIDNKYTLGYRFENGRGYAGLKLSMDSGFGGVEFKKIAFSLKFKLQDEPRRVRSRREICQEDAPVHGLIGTAYQMMFRTDQQTLRHAYNNEINYWDHKVSRAFGKANRYIGWTGATLPTSHNPENGNGPLSFVPRFGQ